MASHPHKLLRAVSSLACTRLLAHLLEVNSRVQCVLLEVQVPFLVGSSSHNNQAMECAPLVHQQRVSPHLLVPCRVNNCRGLQGPTHHLLHLLERLQGMVLVPRCLEASWRHQWDPQGLDLLAWAWVVVWVEPPFLPLLAQGWPHMVHR